MGGVLKSCLTCPFPCLVILLRSSLLPSRYRKMYRPTCALSVWPWSRAFPCLVARGSLFRNPRVGSGCADRIRVSFLLSPPSSRRRRHRSIQESVQMLQLCSRPARVFRPPSLPHSSAPSFIICYCKCWELPKCPSTDLWNKLRYV